MGEHGGPLDAGHPVGLQLDGHYLDYFTSRVHFGGHVVAMYGAEMVAATIRTIFAQPHAAAVRTRLDTVADMLGRQFPKVRAMLLEAKEDLTAFADFPDRHWKKIQSTNPLERINR